MKKRLFIIILLLVAFVVTPVCAKEVNSFYTEANDTVKMEDSIIGDSAIAGQIVDIIGNIDGIGFIAGQNVNITGDLEYGFVAGENVNIKNKTTKNIYAAGKTIIFDKTANIGRDAFVIGSSVTIDGTLNRDLNTSGDIITIKKGTVINGVVSVKAEKLVVEDNVTIKGTLKVNKDAEIQISDNAKINKVEKTGAVNTNNDIEISSIISSTVNLLIVFLVIALILPKTIEKTERVYENKKGKDYLKTIGIGIILLLVIPMTALLLLISTIGISLGLILGTFYVIAIYLSYIYSGYLFGNLLIKKWLKLKSNKYIIGLIGITIVKLLTYIPIIGGIVTLLAITVGLATLLELVKDKKEIPVNDKKIKEAKITTKK